MYLTSLLVAALIALQVYAHIEDENVYTINAEEQLKFGELQTFLKPTSVVYHLEVDRTIDGSLLFSDGHTLRNVTMDGITVTTIVGSEEGYANGVGRDVKFRHLTGFLQLDASSTLLVDSSNHCIRLLDRAQLLVSDFAGKCEIEGSEDGVGSAASFSFPFSLAEDKLEEKIYIADGGNNNAIRTLDVNTRLVAQLYHSNTHFANRPHSISWDTSNPKAIIITGNTYIASLTVTTLEYNSITGTDEFGYRDGKLEQALFNNSHHTVNLTKDIYVTADKGNNRLRIVDLVKGNVSSICTGANEFKRGSKSTCSLVEPTALLYHHNQLFIGTNGRIARMKVSAPLSHEPCESRNITSQVRDRETRAEVEIKEGITLSLDAGEHVYREENGECVIHINVAKVSPDSMDLEVGVQIAIGLGVALLLALIVLVIFILYSRSKSKDLQAARADLARKSCRHNPAMDRQPKPVQELGDDLYEVPNDDGSKATADPEMHPEEERLSVVYVKNAETQNEARRQSSYSYTTGNTLSRSDNDPTTPHIAGDYVDIL